MCVLKTRRKYGLIHLAEALTSVHLMDLWYHRMNLTMIFTQKIKLNGQFWILTSSGKVLLNYFSTISYNKKMGLQHPNLMRHPSEQTKLGWPMAS